MTRRSRAPEAQRTVGRYRLLRPLGSGASATVYLARLEGEAGFARDVALKLVHAPLPFDERETGDEGDVGQPLVEARVASRIRHPNVVPVLDMGRDDDDRIYLVMEYVEGASLNAMLRRAAEAGTPLPIEVALAILDDLLSGLHAAHEARGDDGAPLELVHRDVSPHNVIVGIDGVARLTDFGIAKVTDATQQTAAGIVKGKPGYMAPEQLRGTGIDRRTDVWAAGVIAWEVFAGKRLYKSKDLMSLSLEIVTTTPPLLGSQRPGLPVAIERAVARALSRDSRDRWSTAEALRVALTSAGVPIARREVVAACVRGERPAAPEVERGREAEGETRTAPMPQPTLRVHTPPPAPVEPEPASAHGFDGSTEATASVSTMEAAGLRRGGRLRGLALAASTIAVGAALLFGVTRDPEGASGATSAPTTAPTAPASLRGEPAAQAGDDPAEPGAAEAGEPIDLDAPEGAQSSSAGSSSAPPSSAPGARAGARPPARPARPRPPAAPAPSGKLMDSPYR